MEQRTAQEIFDDAKRYYESLSEAEKEELKASIDIAYEKANLRWFAGNLCYNGCVNKHEYDGFASDNGEHYVYMWKHLDGTPFYIGSGKDGRWLNRGESTRNKEFTQHAGALDAIVYKVATGLSEHEARDFEFCCIHALTYAGYDLAQTTWNYQRLQNTEIRQRQIEKYDKIMNETNAFYAKMAMERMLKSEVDKYDLKSIHEVYKKEYRLTVAG